MSQQPNRTSHISPAIVALASWIIPGAGYWLIGQRARALTVGITIITLFFLGLLIGGIRVLDVPGYDVHGKKRLVDESGAESRGRHGADQGRWALLEHPLLEVRNKPWSIPQLMVGPIDLLCDWWSVTVSQPGDPLNPAAPIAARSHSRVNDLGVLYAAIAGMLNLLAIIDSSHRAARTETE